MSHFGPASDACGFATPNNIYTAVKPKRGGLSMGCSSECTYYDAEAMTATLSSETSRSFAASKYIDNEQGKRTNKRSLIGEVAVDGASALTAGLLVAPLVTIIDKAVTEAASRRTTWYRSIGSSLQTIILRPHRFVFSRPYAVILLLYGSTYMSANVIDTCSSTMNDTPASSTTHGLAKFAAVSSVNLGLSLYKDTNFAKIFGVGTPRPLPPACYVPFVVRDCLTLYASFNLPPTVAKVLPDTFDKYMSRASAAQMVVPALIQPLGAPLHLFGLDLYNRNGRIPLGQRLRRVYTDWPATSLLRMCRVIPAFGLGGVVNNNTRRKLMERLEV